MTSASRRSSALETGTHYDQASSRGGMILPPKRLAFFYNLRTIFAYKP